MSSYKSPASVRVNILLISGGFTHDRVNIQNEQCQDISRIIQPRQATHHYIKVAPSDCSANDSLDKRVNFLEHVVFKIHINHHRRGDLEIKLISPQGTKSTLLERRTYDRSTKVVENETYLPR